MRITIVHYLHIRAMLCVHEKSLSATGPHTGGSGAGALDTGKTCGVGGSDPNGGALGHTAPDSSPATARRDEVVYRRRSGGRPLGVATACGRRLIDGRSSGSGLSPRGTREVLATARGIG